MMTKVLSLQFQHLASDQGRVIPQLWSDSTNRNIFQGVGEANQSIAEDGSGTKDLVETNGTEFQMLNFAAKEDYCLCGIYVLLLLTTVHIAVGVL